MRVFKYRSGRQIIGEKDLLKRDLSSLERNIFWSPKFSNLNDPCEAMITLEKNKKVNSVIDFLSGKKGLGAQIDELNNAMEGVYNAYKDSIGIYSLSQTYKDELLWAHYSNSHYGFCIEYELDLLPNNYHGYDVYHFPIQYVDKPPKIEIKDGQLSNEEKIKKLTCYKPKAWQNEKEYRIITQMSGEYPYNSEALKAIYFGLRMGEKEKEEIISCLKGRGLKYYQIFQLPNSYKIERKIVLDESEK